MKTIINILPFAILMTVMFSTTTQIFAESVSNEVRVMSIPHKIRPQYPFPDFLSTGPYLWYKNAANKPIKGHTYRIATFSDQQETHIFLEKVEFGIGGCCLVINEYRHLNLDEEFFRNKFPENKGQYGFKLIRWLRAEKFEFQAYGGTFIMSELSADMPKIIELKRKN